MEAVAPMEGVGPQVGPQRVKGAASLSRLMTLGEEGLLALLDAPLTNTPSPTLTHSEKLWRMSSGNDSCKGLFCPGFILRESVDISFAVRS